MSQQFVVVRGQIEEGKKVLAKQGSTFEPRNKEEKERLLASGVIAPVIDAKEDLIDDDDEDQDDEGGDPSSPPDNNSAEPQEPQPTKPVPAKRPRK